MKHVAIKVGRVAYNKENSRLFKSRRASGRWLVCPSVQKVISAALPWRCESLARYQNVPWSLVTRHGISAVLRTLARFPYGYSTCRELPRYGILIFEEYLNSFPHSVCYSLLTLSRKGVKWKGGKAWSSSHDFTVLFRFSLLLSLPRNPVSLTPEEKKPIGRTDQLNAYWCAPS